MKTFAQCAFAATFYALFAVAHAAPPSVNPEPMDLDSETNAKIMKEKAKSRNTSNVPAGNGGGGGSSSSANCGQVNINSANNTDKKSVSGLADMFGKQQTTIITGPVINMANCK
jgi:hypothetical protein